LSVQTPNDERQDFRSIFFREVSYRSDERSAGPAQFSLKFLIWAPSLSHDGCERFESRLSYRANGAARGVIVGRYDEQSLAPTEGSERALRRSMPSGFSPLAVLVEHAFLIHTRQNAPYSIKASDKPKVSSRPGFH
jgi:hypothetical protein